MADDTIPYALANGLTEETLLDLAVTPTPGGGAADSGSMAKPGYKGKQKLDPYVRQIARALMREHGFTEGHAIATAKNATRKWAGGRGKVRPQVRAGAAASVVNQKRIDVSHSETADTDVELGWSEALHPRSHGKFAAKSRASTSTGRAKKSLSKGDKKAHRQSLVFKAQREQAHRIIASKGLRTGRPEKIRRGEPPTGDDRSRIITQGFALSSFSADQIDTLDFAVSVAHDRDLIDDIELGIWNEALHPRGWGGKFGHKNGTAGPLDEKGRVIPTAKEEAKYVAHRDKADKAIIAHSPTLSTDVTHGTYVPKRDSGGHVVKDASGKPETTLVWSQERAALHAKIVNQVYQREAKNAKAERKVLFLGGLPGAGKSTSIEKIPGLNQKDYVTINPDIFKEELARRGLVPKVDGLTPMEASAFVHEESSHMATMLAAKSQKNGKNIIWDITMNKPSSVVTRLEPLRAAGYRSQAVFVDIPHAMSQDRVNGRHRSGHLAYMRDVSGQNLGQRLVPSTHVKGGTSSRGSSSANYDAFRAVQNLFDAHKLYDNSGKDPRLLREKGTFIP